MKNYKGFIAVLATSMLCGFTLSGRNAIRNGDFEKFNGSEPAGWQTTNIGKMLTVVSPTSIAHGGSTAVKCEAKTSYGSAIAGMIIQKNVPLSGENLELSLYYILSSVGKDAGFLAVDFQSEEGSTVGMCEHYLASSAKEFTLFKAITKKPESATHCEFRLTIMPEKDGGKVHDGSYIIVDDIELQAVVTNKEETP